MKKTLRSKIVIALAGFIMAFSSVPSAFAQQGNGIGQGSGGVVKGVQVENTVRENVQSRVNAIKSFFGARANIQNAVITGKGAGSLTIDKDGTIYTVDIDGKTRLRRRFFGAASMDEITIGNIVNVFGKWTDDKHTVIQAALIRDMSIQKRFGAFVGDVTAVSGNDITIMTVHRGSQKATVSATTKFVDRRQVTIALTDIKVGDRIRIKGMWDKTNNTITEVTQVKDYSLPVKATPTP